MAAVERGVRLRVMAMTVFPLAISGLSLAVLAWAAAGVAYTISVLRFPRLKRPKQVLSDRIATQLLGYMTGAAFAGVGVLASAAATIAARNTLAVAGLCLNGLYLAPLVAGLLSRAPKKPTELGAAPVGTRGTSR